MRILIENATIITMSKDKLVIPRGYIYIDKGIIAAVGEGETPPDLEFAEYVIDGRGRIVIPGFVVGIGDIISYSLRYVAKTSKELIDIISSLSRADLISLLEINMVSLAMKGVTSIVTLIDNTMHYLDAISRASSESWIRLRCVLNSTFSEASPYVRAAMRSVVDSDAISKSLVSFALYRSRKNFELKDLSFIDEFGGYIYLENPNEEMLSEIRRVSIDKIDRIVGVNCTDAKGLPKRIVVDDISLWHAGLGLGFSQSQFLNPLKTFQLLTSHINSNVDIFATLTTWNSLNFGIGIPELSEKMPADIVILNYREPPIGPIPLTRDSLFQAIVSGDYHVEAVIIAGEIVIDRSTPLTIGDSVFRKTLSIYDQFLLRK